MLLLLFNLSRLTAKYKMEKRKNFIKNAVWQRLCRNEFSSMLQMHMLFRDRQRQSHSCRGPASSALQITPRQSFPYRLRTSNFSKLNNRNG